MWTEAHFNEPIVITKTPVGPRVAVSDPAGIRRVMVENTANYRKDALQMRLLRPFAGDGLLTSEGNSWRAHRRATAPMFSPRQVATFAPSMHVVARAVADRIAARANSGPVPMHEEIALTTLQMLEQTLFSSGIGTGASDFQRTVTRYIETFGRVDPFDLFGLPDYVPRLGRLRGREVLGFFDAAVDEIIATRKNLIASGAVPPADLLTLLLQASDPDTGRGMTNHEVRSNVVTFIATGHETTANALIWTLYLLSQAKDWRARVEAEIDAAFDPSSDKDPLEDLPITRAVLEELMRIYPPVAFMGREAIGDDVLCGQPIKAGTMVTVAPYVVHRHRKLWDRPELFDPNRFLGDNRARIDRFAYIPFGLGPRVCIGMAFAMLEASVVLAHLLRRFRFDLAPGCVVTPLQRITMRPRNGLMMSVEARS